MQLLCFHMSDVSPFCFSGFGIVLELTRWTKGVDRTTCAKARSISPLKLVGSEFYYEEQHGGRGRWRWRAREDETWSPLHRIPLNMVGIRFPDRRSLAQVKVLLLPMFLSLG
jgi:hypothetical protein